MPLKNEKQFGRTISYQNKDITSKIFGEGMKEKSLAVYGISVPKIVDVLPTNLPAIEANELRMDKKIHSKELLTDEEIMQLIILPLTVRETDTQQALLKKAIHLAKELTNEYQQVFALSGIVTFSDKIIDKEYAANIRRWIQMTKVGRIIEMEKEEAVKRATQEMQKQLRMEKRRAKTAEKNAKTAETKAKTAETKAKTAELKVCILQMLLKGNTISEAAEKLHMKASDVAALIAE